MIEQNLENWKLLSRRERGVLIAKKFRIERTEKGWLVPSQTSAGTYLVKFNKHKPECSCKDCLLNRKKCKHIYAVEFYIRQEIDQEGRIRETRGVKITYSQKWKAYDKSQTSEKLTFMRLLSDLCNNIEQPTYNFGRPKTSIQDLLFCSVMKVYTTFSLRRFMSDVKIAKERGLVLYEPCYASIGHFFQKEELTAILKDLIKISSLPLKAIEKDFAVDSSGFATSRFARWFNYKHGKESKYRIWLKAHLMSGVRTNIITGVEITEGRVNDSTQLKSLVRETSENFNMKEISCDMAYSSRNNLELIESKGAMPYIPFKKHVSGKARGSMLWKRMYHYFMYKHEEFMSHYHKRSNSETVFHMIKTKFRDNLRSKSKTAQINELLCKILGHNICVVIQEMNELGIRGEFRIENEM